MRTFTTLLFFLITVQLMSQTSSNTRWGRVSEHEINYNQVPFEPEAAAVILYEEGETELKNSFDTKIYKRIKILNENGIEAANQIIQYYSYKNLEEIRNFRAQTINIINGETVISTVDNQSIFDQQMNDYWSVKKFTFPNVQVGSIIEFRYTLVKKNFLYIDAWRFQHEYPTLYSSYNISNQSSFDMNFWAIGEKLIEYSKNNRQRNSNRWVLTNIPSYNTIDFVYNREDVSERIALQIKELNVANKTFFDDPTRRQFINDWKSLNEMLSKTLNGYRNNSAARKEASKISDGKNQKETLSNIYNYFKDNFQWNNYIGVSPTKNNRQVIDEKSGSNADLNLLFNNILKQKDIKADLVAISGRNKGKPIPNFAYIGQFDRLINLVHLNDGGKVVIDASDLSFDMGYMPLDNFNYFGLIVEQGTESFVTLQMPISTYESQQIYNIRNNQLNLTRTDKTNGYFKENSKNELPKGMREASTINNSVNILMDEINRQSRLSDDATHELIRTSYIANSELTQAFLSIENPLKNILSEYTFNEAERNRALEFNFPYFIKINVVIPKIDGYEFEIPHPFNQHLESVEGKLAYYQNAEKQKDNLILSFELLLNDSVFENNYEAVKNFFEQANSHAQKAIVLKRN